VTHVPQRPKRYADDWQWVAEPDPPKPQADTTDPTIRKLYGPKGETLLTISDRPPVGFHQGTRT
jgi:hypothetical protein